MVITHCTSLEKLNLASKDEKKQQQKPLGFLTNVLSLVFHANNSPI